MIFELFSPSISKIGENINDYYEIQITMLHYDFGRANAIANNCTNKALYFADYHPYTGEENFSKEYGIYSSILGRSPSINGDLRILHFSVFYLVKKSEEPSQKL